MTEKLKDCPVCGAAECEYFPSGSRWFCQACNFGASEGLYEVLRVAGEGWGKGPARWESVRRLSGKRLPLPDVAHRKSLSLGVQEVAKSFDVSLTTCPLCSGGPLHVSSDPAWVCSSCKQFGNALALAALLAFRSGVTGTLRNIGFNTSGAEDIAVQATGEDFEKAYCASEATAIVVTLENPERYADRAHVDYRFLVLNGAAFTVVGRSFDWPKLRLTVEANPR